MAKLDEIFKAYDIRGIYPDQVDEEIAWKVGYATGQFLRSLLSGYDRGQASANRLAVGRDMRPSGEQLSQHLMQGVLASGLSCVDLGTVDTPMIYFAVNHLGACGGVQVTASHNPMEYNGFKVSGQKARPVGENTGLAEIKHIVSTIRRTSSGVGQAQIQPMDLWGEYGKHIRRFLRLARPLKIAVDASNGMAGEMMPKVFGETEIETIPLNYDRGGEFAHPPNPLIEANLAKLQQAVRDNDVNFGVCFDGDADRCMFTDENAEIVRSDDITALLARHFLAQHPGATIVYDLRSSRVVPEEIRAAGGVPRRERVGHAFMKKAMADSQGVFGGELSGHFYFRDNYNCDSGAIVFAVVCSMISGGSETLSERIAPLKRYVQSGEINFQVDDKQAKMDELAEMYSDAQIDHLDGVTIEYDGWWCNVRPSNTEPLLRLNLEAREAKTLKEQLKKVEGVLGKPVSE